LGTGPYRVSSFESGKNLKLEANPSYWRPGSPKNAGLEFSFGISPAEILKGFRGGNFSLGSDLFPADVEALLHEPEFAARYKEIPSLSTYYIALNARKGPFSGETLRHRFIHAADAPNLVRRTVGRLALSAHTLTPPALLGYENPRLVKVLCQQKSLLEKKSN
jgi:ABC-type oligopeptide transport system substrate-binding subunit